MVLTHIIPHYDYSLVLLDYKCRRTRKSKVTLGGQTDLCAGDFKIDSMRRRVFLKGKMVELSRKEFDLLFFFVQNPDRVLTEVQILERVWHTDKDFHSSIAKPINRLRQKIEPDQRNPMYIRSIRAVGY